MITRLSQLADLLETDSLPKELRDQLLSHDILERLRNEGSAVIIGPSGEQITIQVESSVKAAPTAA